MALSNNGRIRVNVTGARGPIGIDLEGTPVAGQFLVKSPGGSRAFNTASGTGNDPNLRTDLAKPTGSQNVGVKGRRANAVVTTAAEVARREINVFDHLTDADKISVMNGGNVDTAYAYNAAMNSAADYDEDITNSNIFCVVHAPEVPHCVRSPVGIRRGVSLIGGSAGGLVNCEGASGDVFLMGSKADGTPDPGGAPSEIRDFRTYSGPINGWVISCKQPGARISNCFITSPDGGIDIYDSSDVHLTDNTIDQGTTALRVGGSNVLGSRNIRCTGLISYSMSVTINLDGNVFDSVFSDTIIAYPKFAPVLFSLGKSKMKNIVFDGGAITVNQQSGEYAGLSACFFNRASEVEVGIHNFHCRNYKGPAIYHAEGFFFDAVITGCEFNGKSSDGYNYNDPTTTASVYRHGAGDRVSFVGGLIANMPGLPFETSGAGPLTLSVSNMLTYANSTALINHTNVSPDARVVLSNNIGDDMRALITGDGSAPLYAKNNIGFIDNGAVASGATIAVPKTTDVVLVTGANPVSNIAANKGNSGRKVTFILGGSQTWSDGGNINLQGAFAGTQDDTITLVTGDGMIWYEVSRSSN